MKKLIFLFFFMIILSVVVVNAGWDLDWLNPAGVTGYADYSTSATTAINFSFNYTATAITLNPGNSANCSILNTSVRDGTYGVLYSTNLTNNTFFNYTATMAEGRMWYYSSCEANGIYYNSSERIIDIDVDYYLWCIGENCAINISMDGSGQIVTSGGIIAANFSGTVIGYPTDGNLATNITGLNESVKIWVYNGSFYLATEIDTHIASNISSLNGSVKLWVYNGSFYLKTETYSATEINTHIASNISALNESVKLWVYNGSFYLTTEVYTQSEVNATLDAKLAGQQYNASVNYTQYGTPSSVPENNINLTWFYDGQSYNITLESGSNGLAHYMNFTASDINRLCFRTRLLSPTPTSLAIQVDLWDLSLNAWESYGDVIIAASDFEVQCLDILDGADHIINGEVPVKFVSVGTSKTTQKFMIDFVWVLDGYTPLVGTEGDPHSWHIDGDNVLISDISAGGYTIYNVNINATNTTISGELHLLANTTGRICNNLNAGAMYYDNATNKFRGCNSTAWSDFN